MSRQVVQLHTIEQWFSIDEQIRNTILKALRVRERLWVFRTLREKEKNERVEAVGWKPCRKCDQKGWVYYEHRKHGIHPSTLASTPCLLRIYYEAMGYEAQVVHEANSLLIFDVGTAVHDMLQKFGQMGAWGIHYVPEAVVEDKDLMIVGHADADNILVIDDIAGAPIFEVGVVHEYKTINNEGFKGLRGKPKPQHKQQATVYSRCLNRPVVVYLYVNKDNSNIADFPLPFDPATWEALRQRAEVVRNAVLTQIPPQGTVGWHCQNCGYVYQCPVKKAADDKKTG